MWNHAYDKEKNRGGGPQGAPMVDEGFWVDLPAADQTVTPEPPPGTPPPRQEPGRPHTLPEPLPGVAPPPRGPLWANARRQPPQS